jgi:orotidine-5'-phosphate decarboxylase
MISFADRLTSAISSTKSVLVAGLDLKVEDFPGFLVNAHSPKNAGDWEKSLEEILVAYLDEVLPLLKGRVAAIKPNLAFYEQYGSAGVSAFSYLMKRAKEHSLLTIADAKRGDIGSTAQAYSAAFLGRVKAFGASHPVFDADALTVNPFLGFDTLEEYLKDCVQYGKGLFVLVKTSNPGSSALQNVKDERGLSISGRVATWVAERGAELSGSSGLSGLGAVVGATYPDEARALRQLMPKSYFLIPGLGAQGGSAADALAGFTAERPPRGGIVNVSRGIFSFSNAATLSKQSFAEEIVKRIEGFNSSLSESMAR